MESLSPQTIEACVDATAELLGLPIAPEHRPGVLRYFALAASFAAQTYGLAIDDKADPAGVFVPVSPRGSGDETA